MTECDGVLPAPGDDGGVMTGPLDTTSVKNGGAEVAADTFLPNLSTASEGASGDGGDDIATMREGTLPLIGFDVLRFKNNFLEMVEELRLRRTVDSENEKHIEQLMAEKHEYTQKLDEALSHCDIVIKDNVCEVQELTRKHKEQLQQYKDGQAKSNLVQDIKEKELKALKDEMRALHLSKYALEKKVQEQERQLQLQNSSRENYFNKMAQLEEKCSSLFKVAEETNEQIDKLKANVKQAAELHHKLEYVNRHKSCELEEVQKKLKRCNQELIECRAQRKAECHSSSEEGGNVNSLATRLKTTEQELKMQVELCKHLQVQLSSLRKEHQGVTSQIKEAHCLLERHIENSDKSVKAERELKEKLDGLTAEMEALNKKLSSAKEECESFKEKYTLEKEEWSKKIVDTEHRLNTLQSDYKVLQDSYDSLEASKLALKREYQARTEELGKKCDQLETDLAICKNASRDFEERENLLREQFKKLQSALDQSEIELVQSQRNLQEKEELLSKVKKIQKSSSQRANHDITSPQFSPEVISSLNGDETPELVIQKEPQVILATPVRPSGQVTETTNYDTDGQPCNTDGQPCDDADGQPCNIDGQPCDGQPCDRDGQPCDIPCATDGHSCDIYRRPCDHQCSGATDDYIKPPETKKPRLEGDEEHHLLIPGDTDKDKVLLESIRASLSDSPDIKTVQKLVSPSEDAATTDEVKVSLQRDSSNEEHLKVVGTQSPSTKGAMDKAKGTKGAMDKKGEQMNEAEGTKGVMNEKGEQMNEAEGTKGVVNEKGEQMNEAEGTKGIVNKKGEQMNKAEESVLERNEDRNDEVTSSELNPECPIRERKEGATAEAVATVHDTAERDKDGVKEKHMDAKVQEFPGEDEGGAGDKSLLFSPGEGGSMLSTQMNQQIQRVEKFLKLDRLRRQKK